MIGFFEALTTRERQLFGHIVLGWSSRQIAKKFDIALKTVETHRLHLNTKLGTSSAADLVRLAVLEGYLERCRPPSAGFVSSLRLRGAEEWVGLRAPDDPQKSERKGR